MTLGEDEKTPVDRIARNPANEGVVRALTNNVAVLDSLRVTLVIHRDRTRDADAAISSAAAAELAKAFRRSQDSAGQVAQEFEKIRDAGGNGGTDD